MQMDGGNFRASQEQVQMHEGVELNNMLAESFMEQVWGQVLGEGGRRGASFLPLLFSLRTELPI